MKLNHYVRFDLTRVYTARRHTQIHTHTHQTHTSIMIRFASDKESKKDDSFTLVNTSKSLYFIFIISSHGLKERLKTIKKRKEKKSKSQPQGSFEN